MTEKSLVENDEHETAKKTFEAEEFYVKKVISLHAARSN